MAAFPVERRALRRHHNRRLKKNRSCYWGYGPSGYLGKTMSAAVRGKALNTPHPCSCMGCGNSRRWLGERTVQERRWLQESVEQLLDEAAQAGES